MCDLNLTHKYLNSFLAELSKSATTELLRKHTSKFTRFETNINVLVYKKYEEKTEHRSNTNRGTLLGLFEYKNLPKVLASFIGSSPRELLNYALYPQNTNEFVEIYAFNLKRSIECPTTYIISKKDEIKQFINEALAKREDIADVWINIYKLNDRNPFNFLGNDCLGAIDKIAP